MMPATAQARVDLALEGMTCAGCATRIERRLNALEGVEASVNLATELAAVRYDPSRIAVSDLVRAVEQAGYAVGSADPTGAEERASGSATRRRTSTPYFSRK